VIASDSRFGYFGTSAFAIRLLRLGKKDRQRRVDEPPTRGEHPHTDGMLFQEFTDRLSKYGGKTLTLFADGQVVEVPVF
jgi:hypothetical protein